MKYLTEILKSCLLIGVFSTVIHFSHVNVPASVNEEPARKGLALVIGNGDYEGKPLRTPEKDATEFAGTLERLGFTVDLRSNIGLVDFNAAVLDFTHNSKSKRLPVVFYFAGHGIQINGVNYLVPIDADFNVVSDIPKHTISLDFIFDSLRDIGPVPKILILDACRANPFAQVSTTEWVRGLASPVNAPVNTLVAFSTDPGSIAADGTGSHSPYTRALLRGMRKPGLTLEEVFRKVREDVEANTDGEQTPWENTSLLAPFYFWDPIYVLARITEADDDAIVLVNGQEVASWNNDGSNTKKAILQSGLNDVVIKVYNQRSYTGGIPLIGGHLPEGWRYALEIQGSNGQPFARLSGREDRPSDNGPRHGKLFTVATFQILVDELTGSVTVVNPHFQAWKQ